MTDFARLVLASDTTGLTSAQRELRNLTIAGDQTERNVTRATGMMDKGFRNVAMAAARMAGALTGAFLSGRWLVGAIRDSEELERTMMRTQAIIRATGGVAGRTAEQLKAQADALGRATLADERQILRVQQQLLTFRNIRGQVFDDAIEAALDLSEAMGVDLSSASLQVARALEDPVRGVTALTRSGTVFTEAQRDMIRSMVEAGNVAGAQALILDELKDQYGGAAEAAAQGLGGAVDGLGQSMRDMGRAMVENFGLMDATQAAVEALERGARFLGDNMEYVRIGALGASAVVLGMYTPAIVTATGATLAWIASLITLRGALMATGIGALIVGAGVMIDFLIRLRSATGSWGEALSAHGDLAEGVWEGIKTSAASIEPAMRAIWSDIQSGFFTMLENLSSRWARFLTGIGNSAFALGWDDVAARIGGAAESVWETVDGFREAASSAGGAADKLRAQAAQMATAGFDRAKSALADLNAIINRNTDDTTEAADAARKLAQELDNVAGGGGGGSGGGGGARGAAEALDNLSDSAQQAAQMGQQIEQSFESAFVSFVTGAQSARQAASQLLSSLSRLFAQRAFQVLAGSFSFGGGVTGGGVRNISGFSAPSFAGGGFTGFGPRSGGMDGKGGFPAILHPNETVIDHTKGGGSATLHISLSPELRAEMSGEMQGIAVQVTQAGLGQFSNRVLPGRVKQIEGDPRRR